MSEEKSREQLRKELDEEVKRIQKRLDDNGLVAPALSRETVYLSDTNWKDVVQMILFFLGLIGVISFVVWAAIVLGGRPVLHEKEILQPFCYNINGQVDCELMPVDIKSEMTWEKK